MCDVHPDFIRYACPVARLVHTCDECYRPIMRGEQYVLTTGKWDGDVATYKAHELCELLARMLRDDDGCWLMGQLFTSASDLDLTPFQARVFESLTGRSLAQEDA